jgi:arylsulfatase A-like enzyme
VAKHREEPFFLFINYMDTHKPYNTKRVDGFMEHVEGLKSVPLLRGLYPTVMMQKQASPEQIQIQNDVYDLAIRNLDRGIGELMGELRELGQYDNSLIIFTSDHGEFLGEHDYLTHWKDVYEEVVHVPLIVKHPGQHVKLRIAQTTSTVQIPQIILDALRGSKLEQYRDQFETKPGAGLVVVESRYSHEKDYYNPKWGHRFKRVRFAIYEGQHKYVYSTNEEHELFDLSADPAESTNLFGQNPKLADSLREKLQGLISEAPTPVTVQDDSVPVLEGETLNELRDLGYL